MAQYQATKRKVKKNLESSDLMKLNYFGTFEELCRALLDISIEFERKSYGRLGCIEVVSKTSYLDVSGVRPVQYTHIELY